MIKQTISTKIENALKNNLSSDQLKISNGKLQAEIENLSNLLI